MHRFLEGNLPIIWGDKRTLVTRAAETVSLSCFAVCLNRRRQKLHGVLALVTRSAAAAATANRRPTDCRHAQQQQLAKRRSLIMRQTGRTAARFLHWSSISHFSHKYPKTWTTERISLASPSPFLTVCCLSDCFCVILPSSLVLLPKKNASSVFLSTASCFLKG